MLNGLKPWANPAVFADPNTFVTHCSRLIELRSFFIFSAHNAATPATCGVAILVPLILIRPPPSFAEEIWTPGPQMFAPLLENGAMVKPSLVWPTAATET